MHLRSHLRVAIAILLMLGTAHLAIPLQVISSCYIAASNSGTDDETDEKSEKEGRESKDNQGEEDDRELEEVEKDYFLSHHRFEFAPSANHKLNGIISESHRSVVTDILSPPPKS